MNAPKKTAIAGSIKDHFTDTYKLLSQTNNFLSRTKEFAAWEKQLREWRLDLGRFKNQDDIRRIHAEIVDLRKTLRLQGYDLSLGEQNLIIDRFRNDSSLSEGFKRIVLFITPESVIYLTGDENHIALADLLEKRLDRERERGQKIIIREKHYLWYRRVKTDLILSGSDTERKEDFTRLKALGEANSLWFLACLKQLR